MRELIDYGSLWSETKTYFPLLLARLERQVEDGRALIVGASDGKFVLPFAIRGWHVTAVEVDATAVHGGEVLLPGGKVARTPGLIDRMSEAGVSELVDPIEGDVRDVSLSRDFDVAFTSCSWHYSRNEDRPVESFVKPMRKAVKPGGLFCAEYMMPVEVSHFESDRYLVEGQLRQFFARGDWLVLEEFYTQPFVEAKHVGATEDHVHRMGFFLARRRI